MAKIGFGLNEETASRTEDFWQLAVAPWPDVVVWAILHMPFGAIPVIVQNDNYRVKAVASDSGELHASHLKGTITHENQRAQFGIGELSPDASGHCKAIEV